MSLESSRNLDTVPKLLLRNAGAVRRAGRRCATRTWASGRPGPGRRCATRCAPSPSACASSGLERGDAVAIIGDNRPRLYAAFAAVQSIGGIAVPVYQDSVAEEMAYVLDHAEVKFAVVQNQEQVDKVHLHRRARAEARAPSSTRRSAGSPPTTTPTCMPSIMCRSWAGASCARNAGAAGWWLDEIAKGKGSDVSVMLYTSGTTGRPKGVMLSHDNIVRLGPERQQVRQLHARRHPARLSAHGLGGRPHLLLRPGLCRAPCAWPARRARRPSSRTAARSRPPTSSPRRACTRTCSPRSWCAWRTRAA